MPNPKRNKEYGRLGRYVGAVSDLEGTVWDFFRDHPSGGGECGTAGPNGRPYVCAQTKGQEWVDIVNVLLHEIMELRLLQNGLSTMPEFKASANPLVDRIFTMSHSQFTDVVSEVSAVLVDAVPLYSAIYNRKGSK